MRASIFLLASLFWLEGCSYVETQRQRPITPDTRIELGWQDRVLLTGREIRRYKCEGNYWLQCERDGSVTYSCSCAMQ